MDESEVIEAQQVLADVVNVNKDMKEYDPTVEVEHSIVSLLRHRIEKIQEDADFEENVKAALLARLPEAEFSELIRILDTVQNNTNIAVEKILSPFIPRVGERVPLLDESKKERRASDESIFEGATKDDLQAIAELGKAMRVFREKQVQQKQIEKEEKSQD